MLPGGGAPPIRLRPSSEWLHGREFMQPRVLPGLLGEARMKPMKKLLNSSNDTVRRRKIYGNIFTNSARSVSFCFMGFCLGVASCLPR